MSSALAQELASGFGNFGLGEISEVYLADGVSVRVKIEPDYDMTLDDWGDAYGKFAPVETDRYGYGWRERPAEFNGNAEKIQYDRGAWMWWQPPDDVKRDDPNFSEFRQVIRDLLEFGWCGVIVERVEGEDGYGAGIVRDHASLWGIEAMVKKDFLAEVIDDLLGEVGIDPPVES